jgi:hypothetical protein
MNKSLFRNDLVWFIYINFFLYQLPFVRIDFIPMTYLILLVIAVLNIKYFSFKINYLNLIFLILILIYSISFINSLNIQEGFEKLVVLFMYYIVFYNLLITKYNNIYIKQIIKHFSIVAVIYIIILFFTKDNYINYNGLNGFYMNRHNLAVMLALIFMFLYSYIKINKPKNIIVLFIYGLLVLDLYLLFLANGRAGFFAIAIYLLFYYIFNFGIARSLMLTIAIMGIFYFIITMNLIEELTLFVEWSINRGMSGRDIIQNGLVNFQTNDNIIFTIFGYGIGSIYAVRDVIPELSTFSTSITDAGSFFVIMFERGFLGITIFSIFISTYLYSLYNLYKLKNSNIPFLIIPLSLIFMFSDSHFVGYSSLETILLYSIIAITFNIYYKEKNEENTNTYR